MAYTLDEMVEDCRVALKTDAGAVGRHEVRKYVEKACLDKEFVSKYLGTVTDSVEQTPHDSSSGCPSAVV